MFVGAGWDGEAFIAHLFHFDAAFARVSADGTLISGPQNIAFAGNGDEGRSYRVRTDPVTGISMSVAIVGGVGMRATAHLREGTYVAGVDAQGLRITVPASDDDGDGISLALASGHALYTWSAAAGLRVGYTLQADLAQTTSYVVPWPGPADHVDMQVSAPRPDLGDDVFWLATRAYGHIDELVLDSTHQRSRRVLVAAQSNGVQLDVRGMRVLSYGDERWLSFHDFSNLHADQYGNVASTHYPFRILKVLDGCTYQTQYDVDKQAGM
jgi:hypothetical protein